MIRKIIDTLRDTTLWRALRKRADMPQQVMECRSELSGIQQQVMDCRSELSGVQQRLTELRSELIGMQKKHIMELRNELTGALQEIAKYRKELLVLRYHANCPSNESLPSEATLNEIVPISEQYDRLKQIAEHAYAVWRPSIEVNKGAYEGFPLHSCSVHGHSMATLFRFFLAPYLRGRVLDIGCGPQPVPVYLESHPVEALYGIDPLSEPDNHPFNFIKGLAEFLPWTDAQFNLVVAATSLDHVLLLDKVFAEVRRVLRSDGVFVVWVTFIPGSEPYDPYQKAVKKVDEYHLFHFDREWFMKEIDPFFTIFEEFAFDPPEFSRFLVLQPRKHLINNSYNN